jgi:prolyl-tRNA synthetase
MEKKDNKKQPVTKSSDLGITADREKDFSEWYVQLLQKAELIEYSDISGCYVLRPWSYAIWECIQAFFDREIKKMGVQNAYFPLFVSKKALEAEKDHIEGFSPEVAWVTRSGNSDLKEPIAVRPTSETIMYPMYANWIRSHRDLPLKLNQWCNVVRWEFKHPVPFLRSREFLWQEGHSAFSNFEEAAKEVSDILDTYEKVFQDILAVPVIKGRKTESEKFAGGDYTTTCEAFIPPSGRAIQACTSHHLGQNFAKIFGIEFEDDKGQKTLAYQNSWGLTTRSIGVAIMVHGDQKGLILPPRAAPYQAVIVPIYMKENHAKLNAKAKEIMDKLTDAGIRVKLDDRDLYKPGWKFNYWELRGVPLKIELGERDLEKNSVVISRRDVDGKNPYSIDTIVDTVKTLLDEIHVSMFNKAKQIRDERIKVATNFADFMTALQNRCIVRCSWCKSAACEDEVKKRSAKESAAASSSDQQFELSGAAKSLCIPFDQPEMPEGTKCFNCGNDAQVWCMFGRSY